MAIECLPSIEDVRNAFDYDAKNGVLTRRVAGGHLKVGDVVATCQDRDGYPVLNFRGKQFRAHRLAWFHYYGVWPSQLDHKNRDKKNFRIENLREATYAQNHANRIVMKTSRTGIKGVSKQGDRFRVRIRKNGEIINIGSYETAAEAIAAYGAALKVIHGEFARS